MFEKVLSRIETFRPVLGSLLVLLRLYLLLTGCFWLGSLFEKETVSWPQFVFKASDYLSLSRELKNRVLDLRPVLYVEDQKEFSALGDFDQSRLVLAYASSSGSGILYPPVKMSVPELRRSEHFYIRYAGPVFVREHSLIEGMIPLQAYPQGFNLVHAIEVEDMSALDDSGLQARILRAVRERGILYLQLPLLQVLQNEKLIHFLDQLGHPDPSILWTPYTKPVFHEFQIGVVCALALAVHPIFFLCLILIFLPPQYLVYLPSVFSLCSVLAVFSFFQKQRISGPFTLCFFLIKVFLALLLAGSLLSYLCNHSAFMFRHILPQGVTLALVLPFVVFLGLAFSKWRLGFVQKILLHLLILAGLAIMLLRSTNQKILPASSVEKNLRQNLELTLEARPRTREILFILGTLPLISQNQNLRLLGLFSLTGWLSSAMNTWMHLHTPSEIRLKRELYLLPLLLITPLMGFLVLRFTQKFRKIEVFRLGYFGFQNLGDDLLEQAARQKTEGIQVFIHRSSSLVSDIDIWQFPPLPSRVWRRQFLYLADLMLLTKTFALGPGGLIQDRTSLRSLLYYCGFMIQAKMLGCHVAGQGLGLTPLRYPLVLKLTLFFVDELELRDEESKKCLPPSFKNVRVTHDWALDLNFPQAEAKDRLIVVLRSWKGFEPEPWVEALKFSPVPRTYILFEKDTALELKLRQLDPQSEMIVYQGDIEALLAKMCQAGAVFSMRYHGCLLGVRLGVPVFVLAYDPKCRSLASQLALPFVQDVENKPDSALIESFFKTI